MSAPEEASTISIGCDQKAAIRGPAPEDHLKVPCPCILAVRHSPSYSSLFFQQ